jgi:hypothetical protein
MDVSRFLAKVTGIYLLVISIAMLNNIHQVMNDVYYLINNPPLMLVTACFIIILGLLMVVSHNIWQLNWRVIITIIAWIVFLKGVSILILPQLINHLSLLFVQDIAFAYSVASLDGILGLYLVYMGFKR